MSRFLPSSVAVVALFALSAEVQAGPEAGSVDEAAYEALDQGELKMQILQARAVEEPDDRPRRRVPEIARLSGRSADPEGETLSIEGQ